ncbi:BglG family transcription antiterminator LicT [Anaerorhabdus sp.]|uniref:BglG family transcription antiterminator LicT n=3 Tax=Anaerorhabdus sp. TaxID=1872524 RepID=UPI002FC99697
MKVKKVFNNNIILAEDAKLLEVILMGKGIGYSVNPGDIPSEEKIEKVFRIDSEELQNRFVKLVNDIPINHIELTKKIIEFAESELNTKFDDTIFIALADHINFAIKRARENDELKNALLWEIKKFYKKEFDVALKSLKLVEYYEDIRMSEDEASFIAMHFVNGQQNGEGVQSTVVATNIIQDILNIIRFHFKIELDEESLNYSRFITHVRFFLQRVNKTNDNEDDFLFEQIKFKYPDTFKCVLKVKTYLDNKLNINISNEEMLYFMLHVRRLTDRENKSKKIVTK